MKKFIAISCILAVVALALLAGCAGSGSSDPVVAEAEECFKCHTGDTTLGNNILGAQAQYANSGHYNGPRTLDPNYASTGHTWLFHGSNAMYTNGSPCSNCHTHQGFVEFVATGTVPNIGAASQPGCFTCHEPHETGDFILRTQTAVTLVDGVTVFDKEKGNLCATCHKARTKVGSGVTATNNDPVSGFLALITGSPYAHASSTSATKVFQRWSSSSGMHHGPQADFITGANNWAYTKTAVTYQGVSKHYSTASAPDSCVSCHMFEPAGRLGGTLQLGGHGMYLTGDVHGSEKDVIDVCKTCHGSTGIPGDPWPVAVTATTFEDSGHVGADIDGDGTSSDILVEIDHLKKALLTYFGNNANFLKITYTLDGAKNYTGYSLAAATDGQAPVTNLVTGLDYVPGTAYEWNRDWEFNGFSPTAVDTGVTSILAYPAMNKWQSQSFWNFKYFMEDRSAGIHNPKYAAQILYDAIMNLYDKGVAKAAYGMGGHTSALGLGTRP